MPGRPYYVGRSAVPYKRTVANYSHRLQKQSVTKSCLRFLSIQAKFFCNLSFSKQVRVNITLSNQNSLHFYCISLTSKLWDTFWTLVLVKFSDQKIVFLRKLSSNDGVNQKELSGGAALATTDIYMCG